MDIMGVVEKESDSNGLAQFLKGLDEKSRAILFYLWWHRHAEISELRNVADSIDDFEVLYRLKEVINRKSQNLWGRPIAGFEQSKIDPLNGEKFLFSWWYLDQEDMLAAGVDNTLVDIFNEKESVIIIAQLPARVDISAPEIRVKNCILRIELKKTGFK
jgi:hypothetical protein